MFMQNQKTNRPSSFRFHRISKANSVKKHSTSFYNKDTREDWFKQASVNSINRGIKNNDLTFLLGDDLNKLKKEPHFSQDTFYESAHQNLTQVRKKYDEMKKERVKKDDHIFKLKEQMEKYKKIQHDYEEKKAKGKQKVITMKQHLQEKKTQLQETFMQKKILLAMRSRLKSDKIVYDERKFNYQKEQRFLKKQLEIMKKQGTQINEETDRSTRVYNKLIQQLGSQKIQREEHLNNLENMIEIKQSTVMNNANREAELMEIAQRALQDKNFDEKAWQKIYLTNVFVNKMLRNKIDKQMEKFHVVQFAFKSIKTATGVSDAKSLVTKYLNKETVYGDLLGRITANEKRITNLKEQTEQLLDEEKMLQMERDTIQNIKVKEVDISGELKELEILQERKKHIETYRNKLTQWLVRQFRKFVQIQKTQQAIKIPKGDEETIDQMKRYFEILVRSLSKCQIEEIKEDGTEAGDLTGRDSARVVRVVPKKSRKNSVGQEVFDVEQEQKNPLIEVEQLELVNRQRQEMLRNNEKFMKQAKKRREEKRKIMLEKMAAEKKQIKVVEIKRQQDD